MSEPAPTTPAPAVRPARPRRVVVALTALGVAGAALGLAACSSSGGGAGGGGGSRASDATDPAAATTAPTTPDQGLGEGVAPERGGRRPLRGFSEVLVTITDTDGGTCQACLLAATDAAQRERGLMEVTDPELGGYDGMLFEYPEAISGAFWMRNTPMPLSIAYFDDERTLVSTADMEPCDDVTTCPTYAADGPFRYALEVPRGELDDLGVAPGSSFTVDGRACPDADGT